MKHRSPLLFTWTLIGLALLLTLALVLAFVFTPQLQTLVGTPPPLPGDDWPTYLHDQQRTSASSGEVVLSPTNAGQLSKLWAFPTGGGIASSPIVVHSTVYVGSWDGYEYALDALKGFQKWKTYLGITTARCVPPVTGVTSSATVINNVVYVGGGDSYWYALNAYTGDILWKVYTGDNNADSGYYNWSSPLIDGNFAYIGLASDCDNPLTQGKLLKVDLTSHQIVKSFKVVNDGDTGGGIWTTPALDPTTNTIYITTGTRDSIPQTISQSMIALDASMLTVKGSWQIPLLQSNADGDWGNTPIIFTDMHGRKLVAATNKNGFTYAFDPAHIEAGPVWERQTSFGGTCPVCGEGSVSSGTSANGVLYMAGGKTTIKGIGYLGAVRAIDPVTGTYMWEHGDPDPIIPAIVYANGLIIDGEGSIMEVLDAATGVRLYSYQTNDVIYGAPSVSHGQIFIGSTDKNLYSFGLSSGQTAVPDQHCPQGWSCQDVGNPKVTGAESSAGNRWSVSAGGAGVADVTDQFRFVNQKIRGDTQVAAQVVSASSQTGLMIRQSSDGGSPFYGALFTQKGELVVEYRTAFRGALTVIGSLKTVASPRYLELQRRGDQFLAAVSVDGTHYTLVPGSTTRLIMPFQASVGLVVSSGVEEVSGTATFTDVAIRIPDVVPATPSSATQCPSDWYCSDVGNPALVGDQSFRNGSWTLEGAGQDVWGVSDQFHFVWQSLVGDGTISTHVLARDNTDSLAKAGIMLRTSIDANAPYYSAFVTPSQEMAVQYRLLPGLDTVFFVNQKTAATYLRVARWNNIFTTYISSDGTTWAPLDGSSIALDMHGPMLGGLMLTSHKPDTMSTVVFDSVSTVSTALPPPSLCPNSWQCADIGYPAPTGSQLFNKATGTWTLQGGGFDIFFNADQFHYVWQPLAGDVTMSTHVLAQGDTYPAAKAGVMVRQSTDPSSLYYAVFVTPRHGIAVQFRVQQGGGTNEVLLPETYKAPVYLRVVRRGNTFTAFTSQDGAVWTAVPGSTVGINMSGSVLAGLAVTSHNTSYLSVVTFDSVEIV